MPVSDESDEDRSIRLESYREDPSVVDAGVVARDAAAADDDDDGEDDVRKAPADVVDDVAGEEEEEANESARVGEGEEERADDGPFALAAAVVAPDDAVPVVGVAGDDAAEVEGGDDGVAVVAVGLVVQVFLALAFQGAGRHSYHPVG